MIKNFRHDGLEKFFLTGSKAGIQPKHAKRLTLQLTQLDGATSAADMNLPGRDWHPLKSDLWPLGRVGERELASHVHI